jgi:hypothetical protein
MQRVRDPTDLKPVSDGDGLIGEGVLNSLQTIIALKLHLVY